MMNQSKDLNLNRMVLKPYQKLLNDKSRYLVLLGSRGSGKSVAAAQIIIFRMLTHQFFRGVGIRKVYNTIEDSIFSTLCDVVYDWGLEGIFEIKKSPFKLTCKITKNTFIFRGLDEPKKLKSLREASFIFFEEEVPDTYDEFSTIDLSIRTKQADFIQIMFAMNPVLEGDPTQHWFYNRFGYANNVNLSFIETVEGIVDDKPVSYKIRSVHTTYRSNPHLPPEYVLKLENEKDPYLYAVNTLGIWCQKKIDDRFYKSFDMDINTCVDTYDKQKDIYISCDFNLYPFSAIVVFQKEGKRLYQIDEICINDKKESSIKVAAKEFAKRYSEHFLKVYICGDSTGRKEDAGKEKGYNYYSIIYEELKNFNTQDIVPGKNPFVRARGEFINKVFLEGYDGCIFQINKKCSNTINDFLYTRADDDGNIKKEYIKDKESDKKWEKWAHLSDSATYLACRVFHDSFTKFQNPNKIDIPISKPKESSHRYGPGGGSMRW